MTDMLVQFNDAFVIGFFAVVGILCVAVWALLCAFDRKGKGKP